MQNKYHNFVFFYKANLFSLINLMRKHSKQKQIDNKCVLKDVRNIFHVMRGCYNFFYFRNTPSDHFELWYEKWPNQITLEALKERQSDVHDEGSLRQYWMLVVMMVTFRICILISIVRILLIALRLLVGFFRFYCLTRNLVLVLNIPVTSRTRFQKF